MRRAWLVLLLVLVISTQLAILSAFHDVEFSGYATGNSVVVIGKWDYAQGSVRVTITPALLRNGTFSAEVVFPNGTRVDVPSSKPFSFTYWLPRTGDCFCSGGTYGGPGAGLTLTPSKPLNVTVTQNVADVPSFLNAVSAAYGGMQPAVDIYAFVIYGDAQVYVSGYVVAI